MENTAPSMPIDVEKKAVPVVERKPIHSSFNNRSTRWMMKLDIQVAMTLCVLCMTAPLAIFALSINGFRPPLSAPRFDMLLSGAYVLNIMTLMLKCHCKAVLDESRGNFVAFKHNITWRLPLHVIYDEMWTRFQFLYVSWVVHYGSFLCLFCLALMLAGWIDLVWQLYRTLALAVIGTCICLVLVQSVLATLSTPLSTRFLFKRPIIGLFINTIARIYSGAWTPTLCGSGNRRNRISAHGRG
ncbi:hypothetical protein BDZ89DRAFT_1144566 [Hymenopellis radicata]|nr:hypothetical protein BDZ89DRAFT_1144566 [Hymenopellis radicata]